MLVTERMDDALELCDAALDKSRAEALSAEAKKRGKVSHVRTSRSAAACCCLHPPPRSCCAQLAPRGGYAVRLSRQRPHQRRRPSGEFVLRMHMNVLSYAAITPRDTSPSQVSKASIIGASFSGAEKKKAFFQQNSNMEVRPQVSSHRTLCHLICSASQPALGAEAKCSQPPPGDVSPAVVCVRCMGGPGPGCAGALPGCGGQQQQPLAAAPRSSALAGAPRGGGARRRLRPPHAGAAGRAGIPRLAAGRP